MLFALVIMLFSACEKKEKKTYQLRIQNKMYKELLNVPLMKYDIVEITVGDNYYTDIALDSYSDYLSIESSTDYDVNITVKEYLYDSNTFTWSESGTNTYDLGTVSWSDDEDYTNQKLKMEIGDILQAYRPVYSKFAEL
jgi:hypothetical protein